MSGRKNIPNLLAFDQLTVSAEAIEFYIRLFFTVVLRRTTTNQIQQPATLKHHPRKRDSIVHRKSLTVNQSRSTPQAPGKRHSAVRQCQYHIAMTLVNSSADLSYSTSQCQQPEESSDTTVSSEIRSSCHADFSRHSHRTKTSTCEVVTGC